MRVGDREVPISRVLAVLDACVAAMQPRWKFLIEERLVGAPLKDIAKRTGLSVNVIKLRLYRGRRALRAAMLAALKQEEDHVIEDLSTAR